MGCRSVGAGGRHVGVSALCALGAVLSAGCPTVDLGETPPDIGQCRPDRQYFEDVIWPEVLAPADPARSCVDAAGCHEASDGRSALRLDGVDPIDQASNYDVVTRFLSCSTPSASPLLTKPLAGVEGHGGGDIFVGSDDPAVVAFEAWFP